MKSYLTKFLFVFVTVFSLYILSCIPDLEEACPGTVDACGVCDGPGETTWYRDMDEDGKGDPNNTVAACTQPNGYVADNTDDNDGCDGTIDECGVCDGPGATIYFYKDSDGDGLGSMTDSTIACSVPEGYVDNKLDDDDNVACTEITWYQDNDGDGDGNPDIDTLACIKPEGYVSNNNDDDDQCNGTRDECGICNGPGAVTYFYRDNDGDGLGSMVDSMLACEAPNGYVDNKLDDDDNSACTKTTWYQDKDGDGKGNPLVDSLACDKPDGYVADNTDDDDECNGTRDECEVCNGPGEITWYQDFDNDGLGNPDVSITQCLQPVGYVNNSDDDDDNPCSSIVPACSNNSLDDIVGVYTGAHGLNSDVLINIITTVFPGLDTVDFSNFEDTLTVTLNTDDCILNVRSALLDALFEVEPGCNNRINFVVFRTDELTITDGITLEDGLVRGFALLTNNGQTLKTDLKVNGTLGVPLNNVPITGNFVKQQ